MVAAVLALPFLALVVSGDRSVWNLYSYHQMTAYWANTRVSTLSQRVNELFDAWPFASFLSSWRSASSCLARRVGPSSRIVRERFELVVIAVGLAAFVVTHLLGGAFFAEEYVSPLIPTIVMLGVVAVRHLCASAAVRRIRALVIVLVIALVPHDAPRRVSRRTTGWNGSPRALDRSRVASTTHSRSGDRVFALVLLEAVPAAHRTPVDGTSLGVFSYENVSTARAKYLHILNADLVEQAIASPSTSVVVLSKRRSPAVVRAAGSPEDPRGHRTDRP